MVFAWIFLSCGIIKDERKFCKEDLIFMGKISTSMSIRFLYSRACFINIIRYLIICGV